VAEIPNELGARLREHRRTIDALSRIGADSVSPAQLMQHVVAQVSRVTSIERVKIMRYRRERGDLFIEAGVGWNPGVVGHVSLAADYQSPAGRAVQTGTPVTLENFARSPDFRIPDVLHQHAIVSMVNVPVMIDGATWGVLEVDSTRPQRFDEWDIGFLTIVANLMGVCLALHDANQQRLDQLAEQARLRAQFKMTIREVQHRIKNNLQIIIAFLSQRMGDAPADVREGINAVITRIQAIALAHDLLSVAEEASSVSFDDYLRSVCANLVVQRGDVTIEVDAEHIVIPIDRAVPAGLVVNELVTNALKYAFDNSGGQIRIHFGIINNRSEACVAVEDNGKGMDLPPKKGVGLALVEGFAQQIQGRVEYAKVDAGSKIILCFPVALKND
jgi:two-component sensor histidine kinase/putative methionine-R-sulfoxide reductase with GAF domain